MEITWVDWAEAESVNVFGPVGVLRVRLAIDWVVVVKEMITWVGSIGVTRGRVIKSLALIRSSLLCLT